MVAMPEPPKWLYRVTFALVGVWIGAFAVAIFTGGEAIGLLDQLTSPFSFILGAVALYLVLYDLAGRPHHPAPATRPGWTRTLVIMAACAVLGGTALSLIHAANAEERDVFELHHAAWEAPCDETEGPLTLYDRGPERQRFLCRYTIDPRYAAEVYVTDYRRDDPLRASTPKEDAQVHILETGKWKGPERTAGTYIKFTLKGEKKNYARYWLQDAEAPVVVLSSMDTTTVPDDAEFRIALQALLSKRYQLDRTSG